MFSTTPSGVVPASKRIWWRAPFLATSTRTEKPPSANGTSGTSPLGRSLIRHESVGHIVHQRRHCHRVDRFEVEDHPGLEIVQHLGIGLVQMGGGPVVGAHGDHSP